MVRMADVELKTDSGIPSGFSGFPDSDRKRTRIAMDRDAQQTPQPNTPFEINKRNKP